MMTKTFITILATFFLLSAQSSLAEDQKFLETDEYNDNSQMAFSNEMPVYDSVVNVMRSDGTEVDCQPITESTYFKCSDNSFFQPSNPYSKMVKKDSNGELVISSVETIVSQNGDILFNNRSFESFFGTSDETESSESLTTEYANLNNLKESFQYSDLEDPQFKEIQNLVNKQHDEILKKFESEKLNLTLKNGDVLQCQKAFKNKKLSPEETILANMIPSMGKCGVYDCKKPGQKAGEKTRLYYQASPTPALYPEIIDFKDGKITGFQNYQAISVPDGDTLSSAAPVQNFMKNEAFESLPDDIFISGIFPEIENEENRLTHPQFFDGPEFLEHSCKDSDQLLAKQKEEIERRIKDHKLAQVFMFLNNDMISFYIDPNKARKNFCFENGSYYTEEAYKNKNLNFEEKGPNKILTQDEVKDLFEQAKAMKDIAFGYKTDGCYARAHLMARRFEEKGYYVEKAWVNGDLRIESEQPVNWSYHVAPSVYAYNEKGEVQRMIIDPSVSDQPLTDKAWAQMMTEHLGHNIQPTSFPFPANSSQYKRASMAFSNSDAYYPSSNILMTEEQKMQAAYQTMDSYLPLQNAGGYTF